MKNTVKTDHAYIDFSRRFVVYCLGGHSGTSRHEFNDKREAERRNGDIQVHKSYNLGTTEPINYAVLATWPRL